MNPYEQAWLSQAPPASSAGPPVNAANNVLDGVDLSWITHKRVDWRDLERIMCACANEIHARMRDMSPEDLAAAPLGVQVATEIAIRMRFGTVKASPPMVAMHAAIDAELDPPAPQAPMMPAPRVSPFAAALSAILGD